MNVVTNIPNKTQTKFKDRNHAILSLKAEKKIDNTNIL